MAQAELSELKLRPIVFIFVVSLALGLPMLLYGPLVDGHDFSEHLNFTKHFSEQFWSGDFYPRWLADMNHGLGSPSYFIFPPLPAYVATLLQPLANVLHFNAFNVATFFPLFGSGICAFLWLHTTVSRKIAAACSALYMLMPYHLAIDFYRRCAIPECWAFMWMPLVLYFTNRVIAGKQRAIAGLAVAYALMIFSHLVTVAMFFPIPLALTMLQSRREQRLRSAIRVGAAMALGAGISAVYLLSGLANAKYIPASRLVSRDFYQVPNQILSFGKGLFIHSTDGWFQFLQTVSWTVVSMVLLATICGAVALRVGPRPSRRVVIFWIAVCYIAVLLMSRFSAPLWAGFPRLQEAIQFPWRLNAILCLGSLALLAICLSNLPLDWGLARSLTFYGTALIAVAWLVAYGSVLWRYRVDVPPGPPNERHLISDNDGWLVAWLPPGTNQRSSLIASQGQKAKFKNGDGIAQVRAWKPRQIELETNSAAGGWVMVNQFYYPAWKAELIGQATAVEVRTAMPEGLLEVHVPAGVQETRVEIPVSRAEHIGRWLSVLCTLLCIVLGMSKGTEGRFRGDQIPTGKSGTGCAVDLAGSTDGCAESRPRPRKNIKATTNREIRLNQAPQTSERPNGSSKSI
jgi:hypothetical protein